MEWALFPARSRNGGNLGVLWVDAHPDVMTPKDFAHAHLVH
jgi:arginase family enzyme